jgi:hypothetical protein
VYLFNSPPEEVATDVTPTLFGSHENAPDDYVVHLDKTDTSREIDARVASLETILGLDSVGLRLASAVGLEVAIKLREQISKKRNLVHVLEWSGNPSYDQVKEIVELVCEVRRPHDFGARTPSQLAFWISSLRSAKTLRQFLLDYDSNYQGDAMQRDNIFKFLRSCEYGLPQLFAVVELLIKEASPTVNYNYFLSELRRWFRPEVLQNLDEEGVPIQISERLLRPDDDRAALTSRLIDAVRSRSPSLTEFERQWLTAALDLTPEADARLPT